MNKASYGRNGDSLLVHMRPDEVRSLGLLAHAAGTNLTRNPKTGYPEAWSLPPWVLPAAGIAATALTAGAAAPLALGALGTEAGTAAAATGAAGAAGALGAVGTGTAAATAAGAAAPVASGLAAAETASAAAPTAAGLLSSAPEGAMATQAAAPITEMSSNAGLTDKANYALGNTFSQGGTGANAVNAFNTYSKPVGAVMSAVQSTAPQHNQMPTPSPIMPPTANPTLGQLVQSNNQQDYQRMQDEQARREQQRQRIAMIGRF
jgi:hypothetical protein